MAAFRWLPLVLFAIAVFACTAHIANRPQVTIGNDAGAVSSRVVGDANDVGATRMATCQNAGDVFEDCINVIEPPEE